MASDLVSTLSFGTINTYPLYILLEQVRLYLEIVCKFM